MARKMEIMDGNKAAAWASYPFTEVAAIYPITPSSVMAEVTDVWSTKGRTNVFGKNVKVVEMQSEAGAAGTVHGSLQAGALTTTYTASQGLLLMIPNMYKIAGELLPCVIHVSARCVATHALNIFGDHSDVYACRQTGFAMLCSTNAQEVMDLGVVSHLATIKGRIPVLHYFDGFRTSHEMQKVSAWDNADIEELIDKDAVQRFRDNSLNPERPVLRGSAQNPDILFQAREACNSYYDAFPAVVEEYMNKVNAKIGTDYKPFNYYGHPEADHIIIAMGSVCDTIEETIDYLNNNVGAKLGLVKVRLYRPFVAQKLIDVLPDSVNQISVLDRTKEPGSLGEPLYLDVVAALKGSDFEDVTIARGRYGLGSKDTTPAQIKSVYWNAAFKEDYKPVFTIGITDDVTNLSLPTEGKLDTSPEGTTSCKFWGIGADGTVGANKNSITIIGKHTDMYSQAYFSYDSKKSGGVTVSHLRFGDKQIKSTYLINSADFVACHNQSYIDKYNMVQDLKPGGSFLLNCQWTEKELDKRLPGQVKRYIAENNISLYIINGVDIGKKIGLGGRINTVLQAAFFKIANILPIDDAVKYMKDAATSSYSSKGEAIVKMNHDAIDAGVQNVVKVNVPAEWKNAKDTQMGPGKAKGDRKEIVDFVNDILIPISAQQGDTLPVSAFKDKADGTLPQGSSAFEKRGVAIDVPEWRSQNCIQCNFCSYVCPHAILRPVAMTDAELKKAPADAGKNAIKVTGLDKLNYVMTVSSLDCMGCSVCVNVCPGKKGEKALVMQPLDSQLKGQELFAYGCSLPEKPEVFDKFKENTVKGSQFKTPLLEFSGACTGCGETPYAKLVTQLFGERMYIANATGCSSIWGGSAPSTPFTVAKNGKGPTWANSLFEDNAEYAYGMFLGQDTLRVRAAGLLENMQKDAKGALKTAIDNYLKTFGSGSENAKATETLIKELSSSKTKASKEVLALKDYLVKKSVWAFGGDGWAYDIGFGGLDHVIASGENVNILVFDTEVYSNTGGQSSKSTPTGAIAQFAAGGKDAKKKDLASIAMSYGNVYVAHVAMGADMTQTIKAITEAEAYNGPSIVIAYAPCINHGIKGGMSNMIAEQKRAVEVGYWHLFRFDPTRKAEGKNPFQLDSKAPAVDEKFVDFLKSEVRFSSLLRQNPDRANALFDRSLADAKDRYDYLSRLVSIYGAGK
ncbi:MAG: pyruvate:ferredoxin (flavodoxin) oxidoreductase [Oscillospiraceae bacterium]|nr:pyruvate:ferredoxin (flavodoxin) oxidoreductase [Oscillospiraceae bacterium]